MNDFVNKLVDLLMEGKLDSAPDKKAPAWMRAIAWFLVICVALALISLGLFLLKTLIWLGALLLLVGLGFAIFMSVKMKHHDKEIDSKKTIDQ